MSYTLVNEPTVDAFPELGQGCSLACHGAVKLRVHIDNAGALWQYARGTAPAAQFDQPEATLLPGVYTLEQRCDAVRFKSLTQGKPAMVSVQALEPADG
jgi:hypothetical protein